MISLEKFQELKGKVEELEARHQRAAGAAAELTRRLKAEYGVTTVKEAEALLKKYEAAEAKLAKEFESALKEFEDKYAGQLKEVEDGEG